MSRQTLAQAISGWWKKEEQEETKTAALRIRNPLQKQLGDFLLSKGNIELFERNMEHLEIREIDAATVAINGKEFRHTDYVGYSTSSEEDWCIVRVDPIESASRHGKQADVLLLFLHRDNEYDPELHKKVAEQTIEIQDKDNMVQTYYRLSEEQGPIRTKLEKVTDPDKIFPDIEEIDVWDFGRTRDDGTAEYMFVEMSHTTHRFQIFRGYDIPDTSIDAVPVDHSED